jgi:hypothetical protein
VSYNIDSIDIIHRSDDFGIRRSVLFGLELVEDDMPESNVIDQLMEVGSHTVIKDAEDDGRDLLSPKGYGLWWYGEGSGRSEDKLKAVLAAFEGEVDLVLTWEGGDTHSGLRLRDGVVTEHEVVMALGEET